MKIKESELIITHGKIYHLGLAPEDLANIIITVGDPQRVERVSRHFDSIEGVYQKREFLTHTGNIGKKRISVIGTGIGPDNIDILINEIDALKNIDFESRTIKEIKTSLSIIRMGTSGALQSEIPVDDIIVSSHGLGLDGLLNFYEYEKNAFQENFESSLISAVPELYELCKPNIFPAGEKVKKIVQGNKISGITLTAGGFYAPQGRELRLKQRMRALIDRMVKFEFQGLKFSNFEMETSSIYGLASLLGHEAVSVNAIIANRADKTFSKDPYKIVDKMIEETLEKISVSDLN